MPVSYQPDSVIGNLMLNFRKLVITLKDMSQVNVQVSDYKACKWLKEIVPDTGTLDKPNLTYCVEEFWNTDPAAYK